MQRREAALAGAEQRVAALTRRLESDLQLTSPAGTAPPTAAAAAASAGSTPAGSQLRGSFQGFGSRLGAGAASTQRGPAATPASVSQQPPPSWHSSQSQQPGASSSGTAAPSGGTFATPASSLLRRSLSAEQQQQAAPLSAVSTAAGGVGGPRRDSFASLDGTPDRQASMAAVLRTLQAATEKGASR